jgi:hypothetical protein
MRKKYYQIEMDYRKTKRGFITRLIGNVRRRCREQQIAYDLDVDYLLSIASDKCPVFKTPFIWSQGNGYSPEGPSLDKVIPTLGYIKENVVFISRIANTIKQNVTEKELYAVADWLHDKRKEVLNALQITDAQIPKTNGRTVKKNTAHGAFHGTRSRKDCDGSQHYQGELFGEDFGDSSQESGGVSMGTRVPEVGSPGGAAYSQAHGHTEGEA